MAGSSRVPGNRIVLAVLVAVGLAAAAVALLLSSGTRSGGGAGSARPGSGLGSASPAVPLTRLVGQRIVARFAGQTPGQDLRRRIRRGEVGGLILFADNIGSPAATRRLAAGLQAIAKAGGNPPLLVSVDQEGGTVRRFPTLPPRQSAQELGSGEDGPTRSAAAGRQSAAALRQAGVNVNLAPVADVRRRSDNFLGSRAFGTTAGAVTARACAFARASRAGGVVPTLKHFPGLGSAPANTDFATAAVDLSKEALRADYGPYRSCAGSGLVMMSSAVYPRLLGAAPAVLTRAAYDRELASTGFAGVTISDDLQAQALAARSDVAVRAARAGLDLLLFAGTESASAAGYHALLAAARRHALPAAGLRDAYDRIVALKASLPAVR